MVVGSMTAMSEAAAQYARVGWRIFPLVPGNKLPVIPKREGGRGCHGATNDATRIAGWWARWPMANIGIATGRVNHLFVVDLDVRHGKDGPGDLRRLEDANDPLGETVQVRTPSGGQHLWFRTSRATRNAQLAPGIDVRGDGGYVLVPPSILSGEGVYEFVRPLPAIAAAADWLIDRVSRPSARPSRPACTPVVPSGEASPYGRAALEAEARRVAATSRGGRNNQLNRSAFALGQLAGAGHLTEGDVRDTLAAAAAACGLPDREAAKTITSGVAAGITNPRAVAS